MKKEKSHEKDFSSQLHQGCNLYRSRCCTDRLWWFFFQLHRCFQHAKLRVQLRNELKDLQKRFGITTVYVTHDQEEALTLSDRIAVFNKGVIEQIGHPDEIYSHSATEFVCNFIGDINRLTPEFLAGTGADKVEGVDPKKHCYIRLERMHVNETMATDTLKTEAVVEDYEFYGLYIKYTVRAFGQTIKVIEKNSGKTLYKKGDTVTLSYNPADIMQYEG